MSKQINIKLQGYFVNYDKYDRAKLMFLDDYDADDSNNSEKKEMSFAKKYMLVKTKQTQKTGGNSPVSEDGKYFLIKCPKNAVGFLGDVVDGTAAKIERDNDKIKIVPIQSLKQHKVECIVSVNNYNFTKDEEKICGWNLKLLKMSLLQL